MGCNGTLSRMNHSRIFMSVSLAVFLGACAVASAGEQAGAAPALSTPAMAAQTLDGAALYASTCAGCHGPNLGGAHGPALKGQTFASLWGGKTARNLYGRIRLTMPMGAPGTLSEAEAVAITLDIIKASGIDAPTPTPTTAAELSQIPLAFK